MKVLITGANGMLARAAISHCKHAGDDVVALTHSDLDIAIPENVTAAVNAAKPDAVFNCAAYTDVDGAEANEDQAFASNAAGPENLAAAAKEFGAAFITISSDYVFNGGKKGFYTQDDLPDPQSVYATSKYEGELRSQAANPKSIIVRSGWIYGRGGTNFLSVVPVMLFRGRHFDAIDDCYGTPTFADDLAARMRELALSKATGTFHAANSGPGVSYFEFAQAAAERLGADSQLIGRISRNDLKRPAKRPVNSRLKCILSKEFGLLPLRDWREALHDHLDAKKGGH